MEQISREEKRSGKFEFLDEVVDMCIMNMSFNWGTVDTLRNRMWQYAIDAASRGFPDNKEKIPEGATHYELRGVRARWEYDEALATVAFYRSKQ